jgi:hypothetical protein
MQISTPISIDSFIAMNLRGGLWHVTKPDRFIKIQESGFILVEPDIPDEDRWSTRDGRNSYPYVRYIGGISLFEFSKNFDLEAYRQRCPASSLEAFIPFPSNWGEAVWLEVDQSSLGDSFISAEDIWVKQDIERAWRHRLMPFVEAAHIGNLPIRSINRAYYLNGHCTNWREIPIQRNV